MWVQIGVGMLAIMSCMVSSAGHAEETGERLVDISLSQAAPAPVSDTLNHHYVSKCPAFPAVPAD